MIYKRFFIVLLFTFATLTSSSVIANGTSIESSAYMKRGVGHVVDIIGNVFKGKGTFFHPVTEGGPIGSCGPKESDSSRICAMNIKQYGKASKKSPWCFISLRVKSGGKSTVCTVTDCCPGCKEGSLDMTPQVFNDLARPSVGVIDIEWCIRGYRGCV